MRTRGPALLVCVLALLASVTPARAEPTSDEARAAARQVLIALRILAYDRTLATQHPGDVVTIAVVSTASREGRDDRARWVAGFALLPKVKVTGRPIRVVAIELETEQQLAAAIARIAPAALIIAQDLDRELAAVTRVTRRHHVLSFARREDAVRKGVAVGLIAGTERDEIVINLEAARAEGARFGAGLLQLARLVAAP